RAAVVGSEPATALPTPTVGTAHELFGEEEISDVSLATFYVFDKEEPSSSDIELVRGGCHGCHGCGHHGDGCHHAGGCGGHGGCGGCHHGCGCHGWGVCHWAGCHWGGWVGINIGCGGCSGSGYWCWRNGVRVWCRY